MVLFLTILIVVAVSFTVTWNLHRPLRERMRGTTTIIEGAMALVLGYGAYFAGWYGAVIEALEGTAYAEWLPENIAVMIPAAILIWKIIKRIQTKTAMGESYDQ